MVQVTVSKRITFWNRRLKSYGVGKVYTLTREAKLFTSLDQSPQIFDIALTNGKSRFLFAQNLRLLLLNLQPLYLTVWNVIGTAAKWKQNTNESLVFKRLKIKIQLNQATTNCQPLSNFIIDSRVLENLDYSLKYQQEAYVISKSI